MEQLFNFGISQDDALTESKALKIKKGDRLLCVASAGEVPLNMLANHELRIDAVDISINQIYLSQLKLHSIQSLEPQEAAKFIGFMESTPEERRKLFQKVTEMLDKNEKLFWHKNIKAIEEGPIRVARFEKYIAKFGWIALNIIRKKRFLKLFELDSIESQQEYFDRYLSTGFLRNIFKFAFHPRIYKNRGMDARGLKHSGKRNIALFFYNRFRDFCSSTPARYNYLLQFTFFNKVLFPEALPDYLAEEGISRILKNYSKLTFRQVSYNQAIIQSHKGEFNKFALSNLCDWMENIEFTELLNLIKEKADFNSRLLSRYIHNNYPIEKDLKKYFKPNYEFGEMLVHSDRYPFYSLVPIEYNSSGFS
ncbi:MAG: DUF3419 family protein [Bacteroidales bacterium]|nr:DUF3419 family protein [Bacteroidales bacterium]